MASSSKRKKRADIHRDCVHSSVGRDVATKGYDYKCLMTDEPSFGLATHASTGYLVCILQRHAGALAEASGELDHWKWLDSPYCLRLYDRFHVGNFHYFVTDPVVSGNVRNAFERNAPKDVPAFLCLAAHHLLSALRDIHAAGFVHLDFDWSHVWMDARHHLYLGGFHNLMPAESASKMGLSSYPAYSSPELLAGTGPYTDKADVWSVGVGILELLTGEWVGRHKLLANANDERPATLLRDIRELLPSLRQRLDDQKVNPAAADFLVRVLKYDPKERPTAAEALRHSWFLDLRRNLQRKPRELATRQSADVMTTSRELSGSTMDSDQSRQLLKYGYELRAELHSGPVSTIFHARCIFEGKFGDRELAIKRKKQNKAYSGERLYWQTLRHPAILRLLDVFQDGTGHVFFVVELMANGNALEFLRRIRVAEPQLRRITAQMVDALRYLHDDAEMVHLNFSWTNVLVDGAGDAKLADFQFLHSRSSDGGHQDPNFRYGHSGFQAPETFAKPGVIRALLDRVDTWALGANLLELLCEKSIAGKDFASYAHMKQDQGKTYRNILDNLVTLPNALAGCKIDAQLGDFIQRLLVFRPEVRLTAAKARNHPWLASIETKKTPERAQETKESEETFALSNKSTTYADDNEEVEWPPATLVPAESAQKPEEFCRIIRKDDKDTTPSQECHIGSLAAVRNILKPHGRIHLTPPPPDASVPVSPLPTRVEQDELTPVTTSQSSEIALEAQSSEITSEAKSSEITSEAKSSEITSEAKSSEITSEAKSSEITSEAKSAEITSEAQSSKITSQVQSSELTPEVSPSEVTPEMSKTTTTVESEVTPESVSEVQISEVTPSVESSEITPSTVTKATTAAAVEQKASKLDHTYCLVNCHQCGKRMKRRTPLVTAKQPK